MIVDFCRRSTCRFPLKCQWNCFSGDMGKCQLKKSAVGHVLLGKNACDVMSWNWLYTQCPFEKRDRHMHRPIAQFIFHIHTHFPTLRTLSSALAWIFELFTSKTDHWGSQLWSPLKIIEEIFCEISAEYDAIHRKVFETLPTNKFICWLFSQEYGEERVAIESRRSGHFFMIILLS